MSDRFTSRTAAGRPTRHRIRRLAVGLLTLLLATMLSGCTAPGDAPPGPSDTGGTGGGGAGGGPGRYVPWTLSDTWVWDMDIRGFDRFSGVRLVYYDKVGPEYLVGTPDKDEALYHAVFSVNPILGRVHEGLLSPHEDGVHAMMFPFENADDVLRDGQRWTTRFYGHFVEFEASYSDAIPTPEGPMPGYEIVGTNPESAFRVEHNWVPEYKWFTRLKVVDEEGLRFQLTLTDHTTGYSGPAHFYRAKDYLHETITSEGILSRSVTFDVTQGDVDDHRVEGFALSTAVTASFGDATIRILDPDDQEIYRRSYSEGERVEGEFNIETIHPEGEPSTQPLGERPQWPAGTYTVEFSFTGEASAEVHIVGIQDNSGRI